MLEKLATVLIVPREQFSKAQRSLESVFACTDPSVPIVYVDGNSPPRLAHYLREQAAKRGFTLIRKEYYLGANEARNLGLARIHTKYVAFIDNDVALSPGWLEALIACAEETGAWAVGPLYLIDDPARQIIHTAGAELRIVEENQKRRMHERHRFGNTPVAKVLDQLVRQRIDLMEFHCLLARTDVFAKLGPLDEGLISFFDHNDFCLSIANAGGSIYFEPAAVVTHLAPPPYALYDLPCFMLRWSNAWMQPSIRRFAEKHNISPTDSDFDVHRKFRDGHRMRLLGRARGALRRIIGVRGEAAAENFLNATVFDRLIEGTVVTRMEQRRLRSRSVMPAGLSS
jgi:glycosyltransferase involved in cell wall biosynthesis